MRGIHSASARRRLLGGLLGTLWLAGIATGLVLLDNYSNSPGAAHASPAQWPPASGIPLSRDGDTLVLFAHPRCPCTRATIGELEKLVARLPESLTPWVVFYKPEEAEPGWEQSDLWKTAAAIPGVHVRDDRGGIEAARFGALTSGQALLYDRAGRQLFTGGITFARGHAGDNTGSAAIEACVAGGTPQTRETPVFGCPIAATPEAE